MEATVGSAIKGYEVQERIGTGGFGAVYRAYQTTVGREVVIKCILPSLANRPEFIRRFETEAQIIARLEHLHIVPLYDYWRDPEGAYLVMRYLRGGSLRDALVNGPYDLEAAANLVDQISSGLIAAHRRKVIHRDLKPANILLDEDGNAYLADFGIAKDLTEMNDSVTEPDQLIGSPDYLAPEQARAEAVTPQTDIYSLGVMLYELLTGEHPYPGLSPVERLFKHLNEPIPPIRTLDSRVADDVNAVIQRATAKNPAHRFADVVEMAAAFREAAALSVTHAGDRLVELLTPREQEILKMLIEGKSNREIAQGLVVELSTVKWHITQIYQKLNVRSRVQAIVRARELNLIVPDRTPDTSIAFSVLPEPKNPYKGLRAFEAADEQDFFGREKLIRKLLKRLEEKDTLSRFLAVVGPSGSGKSSVVKAGLIPALWRGEMPGSEKWFVVEMIPGARPIDELEIALLRIASNQTLDLRAQLERDEHGLIRAAQLLLPDDGSDLLLVIDQFEEVFTLVESESERQQFLDLIHRAVTDPRSRVRVVVTMRADFYDRPLQYPKFGELVRSRMETILPLRAEELERAISQPAERIGISFEEGLVTSIISDVHYQPGGLPLLQYALTELFESRDGRALTHDAYQHIGRAVGALAKRAEDLYGELSETGQEAVRQMFMRLVTPGDGTEDARRRVAQSELLSISESAELIDEIIDTFAAYRLLSIDRDLASREPTVEVAHEALLREWERLRGWLNESREDIRQEHMLAISAEEWITHGRDGSYLLRGTRLEQIEAWQNVTDLILTPDEKDYITESLHNREVEQQAEAQRAAREQTLERRSRNALRSLVAVAALAAIIATGLAIFAFAQLGQAKTSREDAHNTTLLVGAQGALADQNKDLALALALEAWGRDQTSPLAQVMLTQAAYSPGTVRRYTGHSQRVFAVVVTPDGSQMISGGDHGEIFLWDIKTGKLIGRYEGHPDYGEEKEDFITSLAITSDGKTLISGDFNGMVIIQDVQTRRVMHKLQAHPSFISSIDISPDDQTFVTSSNNENIARVWDLATGDLMLEYSGHEGPVWSAQFSPDGQSIVSSDSTPVILRWDAKTGTLQQRYEGGHASGVNRISVSPDGKHMLSAGDDTDIVLWDVESGQVQGKLSAHNSWIPTITYSPDGNYALSAAMDGTLILWDMTSLRPLRTFYGHTGGVRSGVFTPDGTMAISASDDGTLRLWRLFDGQVQQHLDISDLGVEKWLAYTTHWTSAPNVAISSWFNGVTALWNTDTGKVIRTLDGGSSFVSPDGTRALIDLGMPYSDQPTSALLIDINTGQTIQEFGGLKLGVLAADFSPDGKTVLIGSGGNKGNGIVYLRDVKTGKILYEIPRFEPPGAVAYSPDSTVTYVAYQDGYLIARAVPSGEELYNIKAHSAIIFGLDVSPDGSTLVTGADDNTIVLWDAATGTKLRQLTGHTGGVRYVEFSTDGKTIVSGGNDNSVIVWDIESGQMLRKYGNLPSSPWTLALSPDGHELMVGYSNGNVQIWRIDTQGELLEWIPKNRYVPDFSCSERDLYQIEPLCEAGQ